jgi:ferredoxin
MTRLEVRIDHDVCMSSGECAFHLPAVFDVDDESGQGVVKEGAVASATEDQLVDVARRCPNFAISVFRDGEQLV